MNKVELAEQFISKQLPNFQCPICKSNFTEVQSGTLICVNNHSFNIAKKGSLFFLNAPVNTEYTAEMLNYRHQFLTAGFFTPMMEQVVSNLNGGLILDAGSGEGTTTKWMAQHSNGDFVGLDISKPAINIAGSGIAPVPYPLFMVGDLAHLPFADHGLDAIVNILSPANYSEFDRTLANGGVLAKVIPGNHYLQELRHLVYPNGKHATYDNSLVKNHFIEHYQDVQFSKLSYEFPLNSELFTALFNMTPLTWQARERKDAILNTGLKKITAEFEIGVVRR
ncbi:methyltransferase domain-containing protein [Pediococcus stilesii]|uniref:Methyltransferase domain-containing protein n=1 Tax=Pediococcus stilesii TaxID=331679 RepID=A0A5R9BWN7_9LACO|nr:methyltransferase domain-containing protein [Pediococcus stilesii]TLQ05116.1 methyltransferase domain-containing protein [Pediococcus stilesii]